MSAIDFGRRPASGARRRAAIRARRVPQRTLGARCGGGDAGGAAARQPGLGT
jgi:hypothetical protein